MNPWKTLAVVMIFLLIIAVGIRYINTEEHTFSLNEEQKTFAISSAQDALKNEMGGSNYNITVQYHGRIISTANGDKKVVRVVFTSSNIIITALVDMDTGDVVEMNKMEYSGWMTGYQYGESLEHKRLLKAT
ncbi:Uncharacterised protein [uncultured archaeon]|nr:Uncharacterised protein [uncultured archaeon]